IFRAFAFLKQLQRPLTVSGVHVRLRSDGTHSRPGRRHVGADRQELAGSGDRQVTCFRIAGNDGKSSYEGINRFQRKEPPLLSSIEVNSKSRNRPEGVRWHRGTVSGYTGRLREHFAGIPGSLADELIRERRQD